jgi:hypothetical protein
LLPSRRPPGFIERCLPKAVELAIETIDGGGMKSRAGLADRAIRKRRIASGLLNQSRRTAVSLQPRAALARWASTAGTALTGEAGKIFASSA